MEWLPHASCASDAAVVHIDEYKIEETKKAAEVTLKTASEAETKAEAVRKIAVVETKKTETAEKKVVESQTTAKRETRLAEEAEAKVEAAEKKVVEVTYTAEAKKEIAVKSQERAKQFYVRRYTLCKLLENAKTQQLETTLGKTREVPARLS